MEIKYKKLNSNAVEPYRKYDVDAGFDLTATSIKETDKYIEYGTGLAFEIPEGYVGLLFPRSSVTKMDHQLKNSVGVVDASYRGEIKFRFTKYHHDLISESNENQEHDWINSNHNAFRKADYYGVGDRIGQIVFIELPKINKLVEVPELSETDRGEGGYGSTGK